MFLKCAFIQYISFGFLSFILKRIKVYFLFAWSCTLYFWLLYCSQIKYVNPLIKTVSSVSKSKFEVLGFILVYQNCEKLKYVLKIFLNILCFCNEGIILLLYETYWLASWQCGEGKNTWEWLLFFFLSFFFLGWAWESGTADFLWVLTIKNCSLLIIYLMTECAGFPSWVFRMVPGDAVIKAGVPIKYGDIDRAALLLFVFL